MPPSIFSTRWTSFRLYRLALHTQSAWPCLHTVVCLQCQHYVMRLAASNWLYASRLRLSRRLTLNLVVHEHMIPHQALTRARMQAMLTVSGRCTATAYGFGTCSVFETMSAAHAAKMRLIQCISSGVSIKGLTSPHGSPLPWTGGPSILSVPTRKAMHDTRMSDEGMGTPSKY